MTKIDDQFIQNICDLSIEAGKGIKAIREEDDNLGIEIKGDDSPVTRADFKSNDIIVSSLKKLYPEIPLISEEIALPDYSERTKWHRYFLIDPLDGTKEFIKKRNQFTVNIALMENNRPIFGVVYAPMLDKLYFGTPEQSFVRENEITNSLPLREYQPDRLIVVGSKSHMNKETKDYIEQLQEKHPHLEFKPAGSSLKICLIADGTADLYPRLGPTSEWDTAAAHAIVLGAGGDIYHLENKHSLEYNKENILNPSFIVKRSELK